MHDSSHDIPDTTVAPYYGASRDSVRRGKKRHRTSGYFSPWNWGGWLIAILVANIALAAAANAIYARITASVDAAVQAGAQSPGAVGGLAPMLHQVAALSETSVVLIVAELCLLLGWNYRIVANLPYLNAHDQRFSPGWAVAFYFVPLASLVYPYNILQDAWRGSDPNHALEDGYTWRRNRAASLISLWWATRIFVGVFSWLIVGGGGRYAHDPLSKWSGAIGFFVLYHYAQIVERALSIWLVIWFNRRQDRRSQRLREIERR